MLKGEVLLQLFKTKAS